MSNYIYLDFETRSACDLRSHGIERYLDDPTTEVICVVLLLPDGTVVTDPHQHAELISRSMLVAHNASAFDELVWNKFVGLPCKGWVDTLPWARSYGLPAGLDELGKLTTGKGKTSESDVMKKYMKVTPKDIVNGKVTPVPKGAVEAITRYCVNDVKLLKQLHEYLMLYHPNFERHLYQKHVEINRRGVVFDSGLASKLVEWSNRAKEQAARELAIVTDGQIIKQGKPNISAMKIWLKGQGTVIVDQDGKETLRRDAVDAFLNEEDHDTDVAVQVDKPEATERVFTALRLWGQYARSSATKAQAGINRVSRDGRLRNNFVFHRAITGRWGGHGVQLQNLPRDVFKTDYERINELTYDDLGSDPCQAITGLIRPCFMAGEGKTLAICDYAAIECRVIAWLAEEKKLVEAFREGQDVYIQMASKLFGREITKKDKVERNVGKMIILGCGYGMGVQKFANHAKLRGVDLESVGLTADGCINAYRSVYANIAAYWRQLQSALKVCIEKNERAEAGKIAFLPGKSGAVQLILPSGRRLTYHGVMIEDGDITYRNPDGYRKKLYGGLLAENASSAVARDLMALSLVNIKQDIVMHVHDEIVCEVNQDTADVDLRQIIDTMKQTPVWADGLPVEVEGCLSRRYTK